MLLATTSAIAGALLLLPCHREGFAQTAHLPPWCSSLSRAPDGTVTLVSDLGTRTFARGVRVLFSAADVPLSLPAGLTHLASATSRPVGTIVLALRNVRGATRIDLSPDGPGGTHTWHVRLGALAAFLDEACRRTTASADPGAKPERRLWLREYATNLQTAAAGPYDVAFYGDSITAFHKGTVVGPRVPADPGVLRAAYPGLRLAVLGVPGDTVANLAWRLRNGEACEARVAVVLIGVNDLAQKLGTPAQIAARLGALLADFARLMPRTRVLVQRPLPARHIGTGTLAAPFRAAAAARGAAWSEAGASLRTGDLADGVHPTAAAHAAVQAQLAPDVARLLG